MMSLHRARAKRNLRMAQVSALGLVALAGLLAARPARDDAPAAPTGAPAGAPAPGATPPPSASAVEFQTILTAFQDRVAKSAPVASAGAKEEPIDVVENPGDEYPPPATVEDGPPHFRFVGMVASPRRAYAFIMEPDGTSRTLAQGEYYDTHGEWLILGISAEKLVIADCEDNRHEYVIADRPETPRPESAIGLGTTPKAASSAKSNTAAPKTMGVEGEQHAYVPPGVTDPAERERIAEKMREIEDRRNQALRGNTPTSQPPPNRPASLPPARPTNNAPASKNPPAGTNKKDSK
jgi:hypothetical protein